VVAAVEDDNDELDVGSAAGDNWVSFCFLLLLRVTRGMVDHLGRLGGRACVSVDACVCLRKQSLKVACSCVLAFLAGAFLFGKLFWGDDGVGLKSGLPLG
jgi:hypothetical protein